ncbi:MAG: penicillin-binding protein 1C [Bacteroidota bacterium]
MTIKKGHRGQLIALLLIVAAFLYYAFCLPAPLFKTPISTVLEDHSGQLLGARVATDGQWRFPADTTLSDKFEQAIIAFEDRRFYRHPGVDVIGLGRALKQNWQAKSVVSGGSTISMQVIRLARGDRRRTIWNKLIEIIWATRLELKYSKADILQLYATHAPFGGNVVGLETAAWRYYHKSPDLLSWSEAATLAVLPNAPALIHPGRNRTALLKKRNRLLLYLKSEKIISESDYALALEEPLPERPLPLPRLAPHLLDRLTLEPDKKQDKRFQSTLDVSLQSRASTIIEQHHRRLRNNHINNAAAIIADVKTGTILAYIGNVEGVGQQYHERVDVVTAPRSTGSIIKPLLYCAMIDEGSLAPSSLISDVPIYLNGYRPKNFYDEYDGMVRADRALARSLNVPAVQMLKQFGVEKFHHQLQQLGFSTITKSPQHYGLPLILGGAEVTLEELTSVYASMARVLATFPNRSGEYAPNDFRQLRFLQPQSTDHQSLQQSPTHFSAASIYQTFEAMKALERPTSEGDWQQFRSSQAIAWKTGTSFGFRDAWAVGVNADYAVGVWVGNADGEGRPGIVGVQAAAPILFDLFDLLPQSSDWFTVPYDEMQPFQLCAQSGYRASSICPVDTTWLPQSCSRLATCSFHQLIHVDQNKQWQVHSDCEPIDQIQHLPFFVLPTLEAHYYRQRHPDYKIVPPYRADCGSDIGGSPLAMIYPKHHAKIAVPVDLDGELSSAVFSLTHRKPQTLVHWHLDEDYLGSTQHFHELKLQPSPGKHLLTLVDEKGNRLERSFEVIE